jgi:CubicO group peptidase (beta-lactamase class C family)
MLRALRSILNIIPAAAGLPFTAFLYLTLLCFGICVASCNSSSSKNSAHKDSSAIIELPKPAPLSAAEAARIRAACEAWYDTVLKVKGFNGGMIVAKDGNIVFEKYSGTAHLPGRDTITANTALQIASTSKTFTAMAVLKLQQDGKLNIDEEFNKYFPQFNYPGVTIRTLLDHRSGLPNYTHFLEQMNWDKTKIATNQDILDFLIDHKAEFKDIGTPDVHFSYCNTNFSLLALLIEKVTGEKYAVYLKQTFFDPLLMTHTYVLDMADSVTAPPSYDWRGGLIPFNFLDAVYGDKNIYTTPRDLLIWDRALRSGKLFTAETLEQAYAPYSNEKPGTHNYGLGWRMNIYPEGKKMIYHNGWWHGCNTAFIRLIDEDVTIIAIGNKFTRSVYDAKALARLFGNYTHTEEDDTESSKAADSSSIIKPVKKKNIKPVKISSKAALKKGPKTKTPAKKRN